MIEKLFRHKRGKPFPKFKTLEKLAPEYIVLCNHSLFAQGVPLARFHQWLFSTHKMSFQDMKVVSQSVRGWDCSLSLSCVYST